MFDQTELIASLVHATSRIYVKLISNAQAPAYHSSPRCINAFFGCILLHGHNDDLIYVLPDRLLIVVVLTSTSWVDGGRSYLLIDSD